MSSEVIADFRAEMYADAAPYDEPREGRMVMSRDQVVAAFSDRTIRIDQDDVFDVVVKQPPRDIDFIDTVVTIAYRELGKTATLFVGAAPDLIKKFRQMLFKSLLVGERVETKHPARRGGRVTDEPVRQCTLGVASGRLEFRTAKTRESIALADVTAFDRRRGQMDSDRDPTPLVQIKHFSEGVSRTTVVASNEGRLVNLIGRYLRIEYSDLRAAVQDVELDDRGLEALVTLYSGGSTADLARTLGVETPAVDATLSRLVEAGLIESNRNGYNLTDGGRVIVNRRFESINE